MPFLPLGFVVESLPRRWRRRVQRLLSPHLLRCFFPAARGTRPPTHIQQNKQRAAFFVRKVIIENTHSTKTKNNAELSCPFFGYTLNRKNMHMGSQTLRLRLFVPQPHLPWRTPVGAIAPRRRQLTPGIAAAHGTPTKAYLRPRGSPNKALGTQGLTLKRDSCTNALDARNARAIALIEIARLRDCCCCMSGLTESLAIRPCERLESYRISFFGHRRRAHHTPRSRS